jgi:hypothetical protein
MRAGACIHLQDTQDIVEAFPVQHAQIGERERKTFLVVETEQELGRDVARTAIFVCDGKKPTQRRQSCIDQILVGVAVQDLVQKVLRPGLFEDRRGMFVSRTSGTNF